MKSTTIALLLFAAGGPVFGQAGISSQRDAYGNLVRNGDYARRGVNQGPLNNGPIKNTPTQPPTSNEGRARGASK